MRKVYKRKRRSCKLCKPHKMGLAPRIEGRALMLLKEFERVRRDAGLKVGNNEASGF